MYDGRDDARAMDYLCIYPHVVTSLSSRRSGLLPRDCVSQHNICFMLQFPGLSIFGFPDFVGSPLTPDRGLFRKRGFCSDQLELRIAYSGVWKHLQILREEANDAWLRVRVLCF